MLNKYCQNCRGNTKQIYVESIWRCEECFNTHSEFLPHPESLLHEIKLAGSHIIQLNEKIERLNELSKDGAKRCPFCGEFPDVWDYESNKVVECKNESCPMYYEYNGSIFLDVWNTRLLPQPPQEEK